MIVCKNRGVRRALRILLVGVLIPGMVIAGAVFSPEKRWSLVTLGVTLGSLLLFFTGYENRRVGARRLVLTGIFSALAVAGRFLPFVKPVPALNVLCGMYLGGEAGFLSGAVTALLSNFSFGQGPWTPLQMFSWGLIGLLGGALSPLLRKSHAARILFGVLAGALFSLLMDVWTVLWADGTFTFAAYRAVLLSALPFTALYAVSNVLFLELFFPFIDRRLRRIRTKYGI